MDDFDLAGQDPGAAGQETGAPDGAGEHDPDVTPDGPAEPGTDDAGPGGGEDDAAAADGDGDVFEASLVERVPGDEPLLEGEEAESTAAVTPPGPAVPDREPAGGRTDGAGIDPLTRDIEAILFISPEPVSMEVLAEVTGIEGDELALAVETVRDRFSDPGGGIVFVEVAGGYTFRTNDQSLPSVERFCQRPVDYSLSAAAMETLAIVAYLQPITRPDIARIRGIGADTVVASLLEKGLLEESGRSRESGAVKYRTTRAFEKLFGLSGTGELPAVEGFEATPQDVEELRQKLYLAAEKRQ